LDVAPDPVAAARLLLDAGVLTPASVVEAGVTIRDRSRSNRVQAVEVGSALRWFVKWGSDREADEAASAEREHRVYRLAASLGGSPAIPLLVGMWDGALALEAVEGTALSAMPMPPPHEVLAEAGRAIRGWHRLTATIATADRPPPVRAWILRMFSDDRPAFLGNNDAIVRLLAAIDAPTRAGAEAAVDAALDVWRSSTVVHGDLRWDNCMWSEADGAVTVLDWEFAGWGDPAWDLAGLCGDAVAVSAATAGHDTAASLAAAEPSLAATVRGYGDPDVGRRALTLLPARVALSAVQQATWGGQSGHAAGLGLLHLAADLAVVAAPAKRLVAAAGL
jgi:aminoglycoside phosphotransferase (APT) family kinase protein